MAVHTDGCESLESDKISMLRSSISSDELLKLRACLAKYDRCHDDARTMYTAEVYWNVAQKKESSSTEWNLQRDQIRRSLYSANNIAKLYEFYKPSALVASTVGLIHIKSVIVPETLAAAAKLALCREEEVVMYLTLINQEGFAICGRIRITEDSMKNQLGQGYRLKIPMNLRWVIPIESYNVDLSRSRGTMTIAMEIAFLGYRYSITNSDISGSVTRKVVEPSGRSRKLVFESLKLHCANSHQIITVDMRLNGIHQVESEPTTPSKAFKRPFRGNNLKRIRYKLQGFFTNTGKVEPIDEEQWPFRQFLDSKSIYKWVPGKSWIELRGVADTMNPRELFDKIPRTKNYSAILLSYIVDST